MKYNNVAVMYNRYSTYSQLLGENILIYVYAKDKDLALNQLKGIKHFCKDYELNCLSAYIDTDGSNYFENKHSLKKLINENSNITVLVNSVDRLSRNITDLFNIRDLCKNKNINFFDISANNLIFDNLNTLEEVMKENLNKGSNNIQRNLKVLLVKPNELPIQMEIKNTNEAKEKLVNGKLEYTYIPDCNDVVVFYNENSKIKNMKPNRNIGHDIIRGNFVIVGDDLELGEDRSLTDEQINKYSKMFDKKSISKLKDDMKLNFLNTEKEEVI